MKPELHKGHRERLRNRFIETDGAGFCKHELIELLLFYSIPRANTNETAHMLLEHSEDDMSRLFELNIDGLCSIDGVGRNTALFIKFIFDLSRRYPDFSQSTDVSEELLDIAGYFSNAMKSYNMDYCIILNMNNSNEIINTMNIPLMEMLAKSKKEIASEIMQRNPQNIAVGICHTNGLAVPNTKEYNLFTRISDVMKILEVPVFDIIICSRNSAFSMKQKGAFSF